MKRSIIRLLTILLLSVSLLAGAGGIAPAAELFPTPQEETLLALINQARQNPLAAAASMGKDPEKVVQELPGLEKILREGLPPLTFNGQLAEVARTHTREMFAKGYYSHSYSTGLGYDERIRNSGYPAAATGESLGMLVFTNFIQPDAAARLLFEFIFADELSPSRNEKRNILDPDLKEAGVGIDTGLLSLGGTPWNVYLATVDYGAVGVPEPTAEGELLKLINQARANPLGIAASLGLDTTVFLQGRPELRAVFEIGLPPLRTNASLTSAADAHVQDMLAKNYYGTVSRDGRTFKQRIEERGYRFSAAGETLGIIEMLGLTLVEPLGPFLAAAGVFREMLRKELRLSSSGVLTILNPQMKEVGISLRNGVLRSGNWKWTVHIGVCDVAAPLAAVGY